MVNKIAQNLMAQRPGTLEGGYTNAPKPAPQPVVRVVHPPTVHDDAQAFIKNMKSQGYAISTDKGRIQALKPGYNVKYFTFPK